jgi:hypothetical protein
MASLSCPKPVPDVSGKKKKRYYMKLSMIFRKLLPGLALLLATAAFAANKGSFNVYEPTTVSGNQLAPGEYQLKWDGAGPSVDVSLLSRGKVVATVPARLLELGSASANSSTETSQNDDGTRSLIKVNFAGKRYSLAFGDETAMNAPMPQKGNQ